MTDLAARMSRLGTESAFEVLARARALEAQGRRIIHLEIGEPDFDTPGHVVQAAKDALDAGLTHYVASPGLPELREAASAFLERTRGARYAPDRILITPGAKPIMFFVMLALLEEGDEVLYPNPGFPIYESVANFINARPVPLHLKEEDAFDQQDLSFLSQVAQQVAIGVENALAYEQIANLKNELVTGLVLLAPVGGTLWLVYLLVSTVDKLYPDALRPKVLGYPLPGLGVLTVLILALAVGLFAHNFIGKRLVDVFDKVVGRVPLFLRGEVIEADCKAACTKR